MPREHDKPPAVAGSHVASIAPECPRCGYRLTGIVQAWSESCPMSGTCSECGLEFAWRDVLNPGFTQPRWCIEFGEARINPARVWRTLTMMLRPWRFWRELQMWHEPRWLRFAALIPAVALLLYLVFAFSVGMGTWYWARMSAAVGARPGAPWLDGLKAALAPWVNVTTGTVFGPMPATLLRDYEWNRITDAGWGAIRGSADYFGAGDGRDIIPRRSFDLLCTLVVAPIGFVLLPASRRLAKVRWRHVVRIALYGSLLCLIPIAFDIYDQMLRIRINWTNEVSLVMALGMGLMALCWWAAAAREYLRMPHAWWVGLYVVAFAYLLQWLIWQVIDLSIVLLR